MNIPLLPWQIWFIIAAILFISEMLTGTFVLLFLGIACTAAAICAAFNFSLAMQFLTFCVISTITILIFIKNKIFSHTPQTVTQSTNSERLIGKIGTVSEAIPEFGAGSVKIDNETWMAISDTQEEIKLNEKVLIKKISGVKLIVSKNF